MDQAKIDNTSAHQKNRDSTGTLTILTLRLLLLALIFKDRYRKLIFYPISTVSLNKPRLKPERTPRGMIFASGRLGYFKSDSRTEQRLSGIRKGCWMHQSLDNIFSWYKFQSQQKLSLLFLVLPTVNV